MIGFEPTTFTIGNVCPQVAQSAACQGIASVDVDARSKYAASGADLARLNQAWLILPKPIRRAILALLDACNDQFVE